MIRYIADLHFNHNAVIEYDKRPFSSITQMNNAMIQLWNEAVNKDDDIYIVGDLVFKGELRPCEILQELKGHKHLIIGNHDRWFRDDESVMRHFKSVNHMLFIKDEGREVFMCHYPMIEYPQYYNGAYMVTGHIHLAQNEAFDFIKKKERTLNCAAALTEYRPVSLNELIGINTDYKLGKFFK